MAMRLAALLVTATLTATAAVGQPVQSSDISSQTSAAQDSQKKDNPAPDSPVSIDKIRAALKKLGEGKLRYVHTLTHVPAGYQVRTGPPRGNSPAPGSTAPNSHAPSSTTPITTAIAAARILRILASCAHLPATLNGTSC